MQRLPPRPPFFPRQFTTHPRPILSQSLIGAFRHCWCSTLKKLKERKTHSSPDSALVPTLFCCEIGRVSMSGSLSFICLYFSSQRFRKSCFHVLQKSHLALKGISRFWPYYPLVLLSFPTVATSFLCVWACLVWFCGWSTLKWGF